MEKNIAKKLLISIVALFFTTLAISTTMVFAVTKTGNSNLNLTDIQLILICIGSALLPTGSFVGFFTAFSRIKKVTKPLIIAICVLFPITLAGLTIYGTAAIIPAVIKCIVVLAKK